MQHTQPDAFDNMHFLRYDTRQFPFARIIAQDVFHTEHLEHLHNLALEKKRQSQADAVLSYQDNMHLRSHLTTLTKSSRFFALYRTLLSHVLARNFGCALKCNQRPTFRVHMAGTPSVSNWHTDYEVTRSTEQLTAWIPFVDCDESATLWVERQYGRGDFHPVPVRYGEILIFDGGFLQHGSVPNTTDYSRVSMDLRFSHLSGAQKLHQLDARAGRPLGFEPSVKHK
jgi:hypothetical protein